MLIQMIVNRPQMLGTIVVNTPVWVWGLFAALAALGLSQLRNRRVGLGRMSIVPVAMPVFSLWGTASAFAASPQFGDVLLVWAGAAAAMLALIAPLQAPAGTAYDSASRSFAVPGSPIPLLLILAIFLTKYVVGVELAMQPSLAQDGQYTLVYGAISGAFSGVFIGRAARLWRLVLRPTASPATPVTA